MYASQTAHPLYFSLVADENEHAVAYLSAIKSLPEFRAQYQWYNSLANVDIYDRIHQDTIMRSSRITQLEYVLAKNPDSRDVLYELSKLYLLQGNRAQADTYLYKAKQIDPGLQ